ncbi:MAG: DUF4920 domain-containing protein [Oligoflexus sp.]|nr:DUF4920 domain-containing protein [Oligoflexus sp.]
MYKLIFAINLALSTAALAEVKAPATPGVFGKFKSEKSPVIDLSKAIAEYKEGKETVIHTQGTVKKVCEKEGCWMTLDDQGQSVRVFFKDHSFLVVKSLEGKKVVTEGVLRKKVQSVAEQKHLLEDAGAKKEEIEKVKEPLASYQFEATAVKAI